MRQLTIATIAALLLAATAWAQESKTIPAGAALVVRTSEAIHATSASTARKYPAAVDQNVTDTFGHVLIPKGSPARLVVHDVSSGGTAGSPSLALGLASVTVNGRQYRVSASDVQRKSNPGIGKNKRTAEMTGGGAALGTLVGAIAGRGKGAAIGATAGAAAGGAAQVLTKGKEVKVPAETLLTFRLEQPLRLSPIT